MMHGTDDLDTKGLPAAASYFCEKASTVGQEGEARGVIKRRVN